MAAVFAGPILLAEEVMEGWVEVEDGKVTGTGDGPPPEAPDQEGWITPAPVNAHTHVADAFLRDVKGKPTSLPELVGPGGWKHRQLAMARRGRAGRGVLRYAEEMAAIGTTHFIDFRENGVTGARFLTDLRDGAPWLEAEGLPTLPIQPIIMGRPSMHDFDPDEAEELLDLVDGIGLSGWRDFPDRGDLEAWADAAHAAGVPWSLHVSEDRHDPIGDIIGMDPDFVVHMCHAPPGDFRALADARIPVVTCPRSNRFFNQPTPIRLMMEAGCHIAVGTDNGMLQDGDLLNELRRLQVIEPSIPWEDLLRMATFGGRALIDGDVAWPPRRGGAWTGTVLDGRAA